MMPMDIFLMLVTALGCAFIGWAVIYFVSESPTALNSGRRTFAASASAATPESFGTRRTRHRARQWITARPPSAARSRGLIEPR
jgi:hypothetical protein